MQRRQHQFRSNFHSVNNSCSHEKRDFLTRHSNEKYVALSCCEHEMYTDTKNLANASTTQVVDMGCEDALHATRRRRKLCNIWKPLLRLISPKSTTKCSGGDCSRVHPNNVHLNNTTSGKEVCELPVSLLEDYVAMANKVEEEHARCAEKLIADCTDNTQGVISSASIVKESIPTCAGCAYGRNCQHEQFHAQHFQPYHHSYQAHTRLHVAHVEDGLCNELNTTVPLRVLCADDSTHAYDNLPAEHGFDDELLNAWLLHSFRQLALHAE